MKYCTYALIATLMKTEQQSQKKKYVLCSCFKIL